MHLDLTDSFLESAYRLPKEIGRKVWKAIRALSRTPEAPGLNLEKLEGERGLWSFRVDDNYRTIFCKGQHVTTLLFVGPHTEAYRFADTAPKTVYAEARTSVVDGGPSAPSVGLGVRGTAPSAQDLVQAAESKSQSKTGKYVPLARYLLSLTYSRRTITCTFSEIEGLLGAELPPAARKFRPWWANTRNRRVQAMAWLSVGWKVHKVNLAEELVYRFIKL
jgi:Txe/YoeB family toxin of Txe-Axe toxin-antitoxin module